MQRTRFKTVVALVGVLAIVLLGLAGMRAVGNLISTFRAAAKPTSPLNLAPDVPVEIETEIEWLPDAADTGRVMEPFTRQQIESAYIRAWLQLNLSYARQEPYGLKTYFAGPALQSVTDSVTALAADGWQVTQTNGGHRLQLHFYSADGSIVAFTDHNAGLSQRIADADGAIVYEGDTGGVYSIVMFLEDGNWRVRHWLRTAANGDASAP